MVKKGDKNSKNALLDTKFAKILQKLRIRREKMAKKAKKTAEERAENHEAENLMNYIIASTYARHSKLSEKEFLKDIGFEETGKTEDEAIRIAIFNVLTQTMNELLKAKNSIKMAHELMKTCLVDEKIVEEEKKGE